MLPAWYPDLLSALQEQSIIQITFVRVTDSEAKYAVLDDLRDTLNALIVPSALQTARSKSSFIFSQVKTDPAMKYTIVFDATGATSRVQWKPFVVAVGKTKDGMACNQRATVMLRFTYPVVVVFYNMLPAGEQLATLFDPDTVSELKLPSEK